MDIHPELEFLRPLTSGWSGKIELARKSRSKWKEIAEECMMFYSKSAAAMWDPSYQKKFWKGVPAPRFRVTINKAFEMVAVFGPNLIWDIPHRTVKGKRIKEVPIQVFGDPENPDVQALHQQVIQGQQQDSLVDNIIAYLLQEWLNYTPREMPGGGLEEHSLLAVVDALIKGRGVLWVKPYQFPASGRTLTGCFREPPENLYIDPDFSRLEDAKWIALRRIAPVWEVERRFGLKPDSLKGRASLESAWAEGELRTDSEYAARKVEGQTNDMMEYYEVWSKTGVGSRLTGMNTPLKAHLEETIGDYAWLAISPNVPYPLNCPSDFLRSGATTDAVRDRFKWPIETYADDRWPIDVIDFYPDPDSAWPVAPLAPALGELKFLNVMIPHLMNRIWSSSRDFWAVTEPAYERFLKHLRTGQDQTVFAIPATLSPKISDSVQVLQQPQTNLDVWRIIEAVSELFDKRTGLTEFVYGQNTQGTQDRTAETTMARRQNAGVRPAYMAKQVAKWQSRVASLEAFCARTFVHGRDVAPLLGETGAQLWDAFVQGTPRERVARQMGFTVAASSMRRPDKDRDIANINQAITTWLPIAAGAAQQSGDYTPVNEMIKKWGEAADMNMEGMEIPAPQEDEQAAQLQQQQLQMEQQKIQAELQGKQMDLQGKQMDLDLKQVDAIGKQQQARLTIEGKMQDMQVKQQAAKIDAVTKIEQGRQSLEQKDAEHQIGMSHDVENFAREHQQDRVDHERESLQDSQKFEQELEQTRELNAVKVALARQQARAKPAAGGADNAKK